MSAKRDDEIRVFLSQPMRGRSDEEVLAEREEVMRKIKSVVSNPVVTVDSFIDEEPPDDVRNAPLWLLGRSIELLSTADAAYFCGGWRGYRGCRVENECAKEYGITVIEE